MAEKIRSRDAARRKVENKERERAILLDLNPRDADDAMGGQQAHGDTNVRRGPRDEPHPAGGIQHQPFGHLGDLLNK